MMKSIVIIRLDDWEVIYYKGKIFTQGHETEREDYKHLYKQATLDGVIDDEIVKWIDNAIDFPKDYNDLPEEIKIILEKE